jgi:glycosyltransferase involved in cell wall biosynthesis
MVSKLDGYIIITPCKNEQENIEQLMNSVINQTIKPRLWLIINDGSTDNTLRIIEKIIKKNNWIRVVSLKKSERTLRYKFSKIVKLGLDTATKICAQENIQYQYLANLDADMILTKNYYETLMLEMKKPRVGIVGSWFYSRKNNKLVLENDSKISACGGTRLIKKKCYFDIGGIPLTKYSYDTISNTLAIEKGWQISIVNTVHAIQIRETNSAQGLYAGWIKCGNADHYINRPITYSVYKILKLMTNFKIIESISYIKGYFGSIINRKEKTQYSEVREHYKKFLMNYFLKKRKKNIVFFRNDDVENLTKTLTDFTEYFLLNDIAISQGVIPGNITKKTASWLNEIENKYKYLIEIDQHGYKHIDYGCGEFGRCRNKQQQTNDIVKGKKIMNTLFGKNFSRVFIPPKQFFSKDTIEILENNNYKILSGYVSIKNKKLLLYRLGIFLKRYNFLGKEISYHEKRFYDKKLRELSISVDVVKSYKDKIIINKYEENVKNYELAKKKHKIVGIMTHHEMFNDPQKMKELKRFIDYVKRDKNIYIKKLEDI